MEFEVLKKHISEVLGVDANEITEDMEFDKDLGADSLDTFQILMDVEEELGMTVDEEKAESIKTVGDAVRLIKETMEA
ncbi:MULTISPECIES: acyl carrier protein [Shuttleworthella]|uniref:Acyl carrier protein n=1 Tax=Shuttleworthella satelles DSM 14600 TaxID=626523 RepID=C4GAY2_9FIRM|nr:MULTISPECIES: acyl carrier protein [Shuttleworthia]EEP28275.1 acyl carrier protein [Shuttleworthia satelles DSM 14600]EUB17577.1 acyl carrier protein [Shuttleworthia sp. MSX8B]